MNAPSASPVLETDRLSVAYAGAPVVRDVSLEVGTGMCLAVLGPSGSGKTTLLHAVAGFIEPASGEIRIRGRRVAGGGARSVPPEQRGVGVVFQHYALWPHLDALETVAYPLRRRGLSRAQALERAGELLSRVGIAHLADRHPAELSGGEQQRVGLARALARAPDVYLLDEPTAHLDTPLRTALQEELAMRAGETGAAILYATHDVAEAMAVADRVALMRDGRIAQVGDPTEVYQRPVDAWSALLTGPASVLAVELSGVDGRMAQVRIGPTVVGVACDATPGTAATTSSVLVRPDWARLGSGELDGRVSGVWYRGTHTDYRVDTDAGPLTIREAGSPRLAVGSGTRWELLRAWPIG